MSYDEKPRERGVKKEKKKKTHMCTDFFFWWNIICIESSKEAPKGKNKYTSKEHEAHFLDKYP